MIQNNLKISWRHLIKNPLYSLINVAGLAIGMALCILITLYVKDELSFDQFLTKKNEIYRIVTEERSPDGELFSFGQTGMVHGPAFKNQISAFKNVVRYREENVLLKLKGEMQFQTVFLVDSTFFSMFDLPFIAGNSYKALNDIQSIVISEKLANKYFGKTDVVGQNMELKFEDELQNFVVNGVIKDLPINSSLQADVLIPMHKSKSIDTEWINFYINTFVEIPAGSSIPNLEKQMASIFASDAKEQLASAAKEWNYKNKLTFKLQPFLQMHLSRDYKASNGLKESGNIKFSYFLSGVALFILIIACINFINLAIARSVQRSKEIGIRKTIGSTRIQLINQFIGESFLLNTFAFVLGLILAYSLLPVFNELTSKQLAISYLWDSKLLTIFLLIFLLTGLLAGFYPALILSNFQPIETLNGKQQFGGKNILQKSLIVFQFALASFFIVSALVQYQQSNYFLSRDLGYDDKNLIKVDASSMDVNKVNTITSELLKNKNILSVTPMRQGDWYTLATTADGKEISPKMMVTNHNFLSTFGLSIAKGRFLSSEFPSDSTNSVVVNEAFAKEAGWADPIGQVVKVMNRDKYQVVGVLKDYHHSNLYEKIGPQLFTANPNYSLGSLCIRINEEDKPNTLAFIKNKFHNFFPAYPYTYKFISDVNDTHYEKEIKMRSMLLYSALLIIFISCIGMFGLAALTTQRKTKEIGIRKIMGASISNIVVMISTHFIKLVLLAFLISAPFSYYAIKITLQNLPFHIDVKWDVYIICLVTILIIALLTSSYQAIKAGWSNPVKALKTE